MSPRNGDVGYVAEEPSQTRKRLRAMRMHNAGTGSATGRTGTNAEVSSQRQGKRKAEGGEEGAQVNDGQGVGAGRMRL